MPCRTPTRSSTIRYDFNTSLPGGLRRRAAHQTRGHDHAPGLPEALSDHGFVADEIESILIGDAKLLAADVGLSTGVTLRRVTSEGDVRAMSAMQDLAFGDPVHSDNADARLDRLELNDGITPG